MSQSRTLISFNIPLPICCLRAACLQDSTYSPRNSIAPKKMGQLSSILASFKAGTCTLTTQYTWTTIILVCIIDTSLTQILRWLKWIDLRSLQTTRCLSIRCSYHKPFSSRTRPNRCTQVSWTKTSLFLITPARLCFHQDELEKGQPSSTQSKR